MMGQNETVLENVGYVELLLSTHSPNDISHHTISETYLEVLIIR